MGMAEFEAPLDLDEYSPDSKTECSSPGDIHTGMLVHEFFQKIVGASIPAPQTRDRGVSGLSTLVFTHSCRSTSCSDVSCSLCRNSLLPQCQDGDFFKDRIVRGREPLRAKCSAPIEVCFQGPVGGMKLDDDLNMRVIVVDGRAFDQDLGHLHSAGCLTQTHVYNWINGSTHEESPLMDCKLQNGMATKQGIPVQMKGNCTALPDIYLAENSKKNHERSSYYRLLCIADVHYSFEIHAAVSPKLKTISTRFWRDPTRTKETPHETDSVKKLPKIGLERARILEEMNIRTVGDLRQEIGKSAQHKVNVGKQVMGCENADWENVYSTVMSCTQIDNRPRVWYYRTDCGDVNFAIFASNQAVIDWNGPTGVFLHGHGVIPSTELDPMDVSSVRNAALEDWKRPGHPNWDVFESESGQVRKTQRKSPFSGMSPPPDSSFPISTSSKQNIDLWNSDLLDDEMCSLSHSLGHMSLEEFRDSDLQHQTCRSSLSSLELLRLLQDENIPSIS